MRTFVQAENQHSTCFFKAATEMWSCHWKYSFLLGTLQVKWLWNSVILWNILTPSWRGFFLDIGRICYKSHSYGHYEGINEKAILETRVTGMGTQSRLVGWILDCACDAAQGTGRWSDYVVLGRLFPGRAPVQEEGSSPLWMKMPNTYQLTENTPKLQESKTRGRWFLDWEFH